MDAVRGVDVDVDAVFDLLELSALDRYIFLWIICGVGSSIEASESFSI